MGNLEQSPMPNVLENLTAEQNKKRMSDNKLQTEAKLLSNNILKDVFQELHNAVVNNIDTSCVLDKLFSAKVITHIDMHELEFIKKPLKQCRRLLIILHKVQNPRTFIELREAIANQESYGWFVEIIDEKYNLLTSPSIQPQPQVNGVLSNPLLKENTRLLEENAKQKLNNERISKDNATLTTENSKLLEDIKSLKDDNEQLCLERSDYENKMVKIVDELKKELASVRKSQNDPRLLFTLDQQPTDSNGEPRQVRGVVMMDNYLYVVYEDYNKVEVFSCDIRCEKIKDIPVEGMVSPWDMVGSSLTSQLFISDGSDVILRVTSKTGVSDVFIKTGYTRPSLVENRLLVTSRDSLLMFDIVSSERLNKIPLTYIQGFNVLHAVESNRDSFLVSHGPLGYSSVSEIDSEGRVIRVLDNEQQLDCYHLAFDSVGRLLVADYKNSQVVLFDEHLKYERILIDNKRLDNSWPIRLNYNKNNNRLTVGLNNGQVKIFDY